jgi:hypothetical protein
MDGSIEGRKKGERERERERERRNRSKKLQYVREIQETDGEVCTPPSEVSSNA